MDTCRYCKKPLEADSTKCPSCLGWQGSFLPDLQSPRGALIFLAATIVVVFVPIYFLSLSKFWISAPSPSVIEIVESDLHHGDETCAGGHYLAVIGHLKNTSSEPIATPHFVVSFLGADGELIDSFASDSYDLVVPPGEQVSFRVRDRAHHPATSYHDYTIRVTAVRRPR